VEHEVGDGGAPPPPDPAGHPLLKGLEVGPPAGVEGHDLAVEHPDVVAERAGQPAQLREPPGHVDPVPTPQDHPTTHDMP